jgi:hypothetical protein
MFASRSSDSALVSVATDRHRSSGVLPGRFTLKGRAQPSDDTAARVGKRDCAGLLPSGLIARSQPAAGNCSNKRVTWRFRMCLFAGGQARMTLSKVSSTTLQARG